MKGNFETLISIKDNKITVEKECRNWYTLRYVILSLVDLKWDVDRRKILNNKSNSIRAINILTNYLSSFKYAWHILCRYLID